MIAKLKVLFKKALDIIKNGKVTIKSLLDAVKNLWNKVKPIWDKIKVFIPKKQAEEVVEAPVEE